MSLIPYVPDELVFLLVGSGITFFLGREGMRAAFKKEAKQNIVEQLVKDLGFKNMKVQDLNSDKLDDKGFSRLVALLQVLKQPSFGGGTGSLGGLRELQELQSALASLRPTTTPQPVSPAPGNPPAPPTTVNPNP